jgi:hypothetical protein
MRKEVRDPLASLVFVPVHRAVRFSSPEFLAAPPRRPSAPPRRRRFRRHRSLRRSALHIGASRISNRAPEPQIGLTGELPPPLAAGRRRRLATRRRQRSRAIRAVGLRSDAPVQSRRPQATVALGSRSNGSRSSQPRVNRPNPAGPGSFTENPQVFRYSQKYPSILEVFLQFSPFLYFSLEPFQIFTV